MDGSVSFPVQQLDGGRLGRRGEVHVALRGAQVLVSSQLLDGLRRRPQHREARAAEGVAEDMDAAGD
jgi:hypothetical protein